MPKEMRLLSGNMAVVQDLAAVHPEGLRAQEFIDRGRGVFATRHTLYKLRQLKLVEMQPPDPAEPFAIGSVYSLNDTGLEVVENIRPARSQVAINGLSKVKEFITSTLN